MSDKGYLEQKAGDYQHRQEAVNRPDVGLQDKFYEKRGPKTYRYDSSLDPQLSYDENYARELGEWLLGLIERATEEGEATVFAEPQNWQGDGTRVESIKATVKLLKTLSRPFLNWSGKAERYQLSIPTVPLFIHERHSTKAILETIKHRKAKGENLDLFADRDTDISDRLDAYHHKGPWVNRLILGDSLHVMNSLLEYEGLGGQVQMIYMDPPYGVKFGSNFQPFVRKRDVKHGKDEDMIREPEMVKAYRDTWELGLHSYLTYLCDRLLLARELLTESGSIFVQISDKNLHHVREVMDEVFGSGNFCSIITFAKTGGQAGFPLTSHHDYLIWYAKDKAVLKYREIYLPKGNDDAGTGGYDWIEEPDGKRRRLTKEEIENPRLLIPGSKLFALGPLYSEGATKAGSFEINYDGRTFKVPPGRHWKTTEEGIRNLEHAQRLWSPGSDVRYVRYAEDFPCKSLSAVWDDTSVGGYREAKVYVVQTAVKVVERCLLMSTDPGDLVFDPTCGSGTTAYVAERWGRRWITCDTSRVPLALARQRLLTATFPWYELKDPSRGPAGSFVYVRKQNRKGEEIGGLVPHITLKSIANNEPPVMEVLVDRPEINNGITRVTGPFTVEATIPPADDLAATGDRKIEETSAVYGAEPGTYLDRMVEVLRRCKTLRLPGNKTLSFEVVHRLADMEFLHAEAIEKNNEDKRVAIVFGPSEGAITSDLVVGASAEAYWQKQWQHLYLFGFAIQAKAREFLDDQKKTRIPCTYVAVTPDVVMSDLLKTTPSSEIFAITGLPDIAIKQTQEKAATGEPLYQVEVKGLDIFDPATMETRSIEADNLPCWMLDTDYNDLCFYATQVFFPKTSAWDNLQRSLKGAYEPAVWAHLAGTVSELFSLGQHRKIAVKVIDDRGNELMVVREVKI